MRYFFEVSYNGSAWHGWQAQKNAKTVQGELEDKLTTVFRKKISITGSGRTDTGVHCLQQYFHIDLNAEISDPYILYKLNSYLPPSIALLSFYAVPPEAHARFDAISREYEYIICRIKDPFMVGKALFYFRDLDVKEMQKASKLLIGEKDFKCFSKVKTDVNTFVCNIYEAEWVEIGNRLLFKIKANRFLRGMVRAIVGTMLDIGEGKIKAEDMTDILQSGDRSMAGSAAYASGLYLKRVIYPESIITT